MVCKYCGCDVGSQDKFCINCGGALQDDNTSNYKCQTFDTAKNTYAESFNLNDELRKLDIKEAEEFFKMPKTNGTTTQKSYSQTTKTVYSRGHSVSTPFTNMEEILGGAVGQTVSTCKKHKKPIIIAAISLAVFLTVVLVIGFVVFNNFGFGANISSTNFEKLEIGMTYYEVVEIIGRDCDKEMSFDFGNSTRNCEWTDNFQGQKVTISVTFVDDLLTKKSYKTY